MAGALGLRSVGSRRERCHAAETAPKSRDYPIGLGNADFSAEFAADRAAAVVAGARLIITATRFTLGTGRADPVRGDYDHPGAAIPGALAAPRAEVGHCRDGGVRGAGAGRRPSAPA